MTRKLKQQLLHCSMALMTAAPVATPAIQNMMQPVAAHASVRNHQEKRRVPSYLKDNLVDRYGKNRANRFDYNKAMNLGNRLENSYRNYNQNHKHKMSKGEYFSQPHGISSVPLVNHHENVGGNTTNAVMMDPLTGGEVRDGDMTPHNITPSLNGKTISGPTRLIDPSSPYGPQYERDSVTYGENNHTDENPDDTNGTGNWGDSQDIRENPYQNPDDGNGEGVYWLGGDSPKPKKRANPYKGLLPMNNVFKNNKDYYFTDQHGHRKYVSPKQYRQLQNNVNYYNNLTNGRSHKRSRRAGRRSRNNNADAFNWPADNYGSLIGNGRNNGYLNDGDYDSMPKSSFDKGLETAVANSGGHSVKVTAYNPNTGQRHTWKVPANQVKRFEGDEAGYRDLGWRFGTSSLTRRHANNASYDTDPNLLPTSGSYKRNSRKGYDYFDSIDPQTGDLYSYKVRKGAWQRRLICHRFIEPNSTFNHESRQASRYFQPSKRNRNRGRVTKRGRRALRHIRMRRRPSYRGLSRRIQARRPRRRARRTRRAPRYHYGYTARQLRNDTPRTRRARAYVAHLWRANHDKHGNHYMTRHQKARTLELNGVKPARRYRTHRAKRHSLPYVSRRKRDALALRERWGLEHPSLKEYYEGLSLLNKRHPKRHHHSGTRRLSNRELRSLRTPSTKRYLASISRLVREQPRRHHRMRPTTRTRKLANGFKVKKFTIPIYKHGRLIKIHHATAVIAPRFHIRHKVDAVAMTPQRRGHHHKAYDAAYSKAVLPASYHSKVYRPKTDSQMKALTHKVSAVNRSGSGVGILTNEPKSTIRAAVRRGNHKIAQNMDEVFDVYVPQNMSSGQFNDARNYLDRHITQLSNPSTIRNSNARRLIYDYLSTKPDNGNNRQLLHFVRSNIKNENTVRVMAHYE